MTDALRTVAHGLRTVANGINLTFIPTVIGGLFAWLRLGYDCLLLFTGLAVLGLVVTAIGRCFCLRTPPEMPVARGRIFLAVILDLTGLLSTAALVISQFVTSVFPPMVVLIGLGFSTVTLLAGRVMFFLFLHALSASFHPTYTADVRSATLWSILAGGWLCVSFGVVLSVGRGKYPEAYFFGSLVAGIVGCLILGGIWWRVYTRTLNRLNDAVEALATDHSTHPDDPDREYRAHYPADATDDPS